MKRIASVFASGVLAVTPLVLAASHATPAVAATTNNCTKITQAVVVADGFKNATPAMITNYNYTKPSANPANALGMTIDFGAQALVVSCVSPADIAKLSTKPNTERVAAMTATHYMAYMVKQSDGAMKKTMVGGVADYLDFCNGKEDGLGSTTTAASVRLDAWVAGKYIVLTQTEPAGPPSAALLKFIASTKSLL